MPGVVFLMFDALETGLKFNDFQGPSLRQPTIDGTCMRRAQLDSSQNTSWLTPRPWKQRIGDAATSAGRPRTGKQQICSCEAYACCLEAPLKRASELIYEALNDFVDERSTAADRAEADTDLIAKSFVLLVTHAVIWEAWCLHFGILGDYFGSWGYPGRPWQQEEGRCGSPESGIE